MIKEVFILTITMLVLVHALPTPEQLEDLPDNVAYDVAVEPEADSDDFEVAENRYGGYGHRGYGGYGGYGGHRGGWGGHRGHRGGYGHGGWGRGHYG